MASPASLTLTPSSVLHVSPELFNPKPDWSLQDLKEELDALSSKFKVTPTQKHTPSPHSTASYSFSWRELSVAADFGRAGRPFRICAFDDGSESELEDLSDAQSKERSDDINAVRVIKVQSTTNASGHGKSDSPAQEAEIDKKPWLLSRSETSEGLVLELEHERLQRIQEEVRQRRSILEASIEAESIKATANIQQVVKEEDLKKEMARKKDQLYQRSIAEVRDTHLSALQREHEQRSQVEEKKIRKEAEARKREILAREERERQEKLKAEAEAKKKSDAILAAEGERKKKAEAAAAAALQRAEAEGIAKAAQEQSAPEQATRETAASFVSSVSRITTEPKPIVSKVAADFEHMRHMKLEELLEASRTLQMNAPLKKVLKDQERILTKLLQQVSATQEQVRTKSINLMKELAPSPNQPFTLTTFASKLMSQCEIQVSKLPPFAFALAQVVVNISLHIPELMEVVLATMNQVCIFTVPKYYVFKKVFVAMEEQGDEQFYNFEDMPPFISPFPILPPDALDHDEAQRILKEEDQRIKNTGVDAFMTEMPPAEGLEGPPLSLEQCKARVPNSFVRTQLFRQPDTSRQKNPKRRYPPSLSQLQHIDLSKIILERFIQKNKCLPNHNQIPIYFVQHLFCEEFLRKQVNWDDKGTLGGVAFGRPVDKESKDHWDALTKNKTNNIHT